MIVKKIKFKGRSMAGTPVYKVLNLSKYSVAFRAEPVSHYVNVNKVDIYSNNAATIKFDIFSPKYLDSINIKLVGYNIIDNKKIKAVVDLRQYLIDKIESINELDKPVRDKWSFVNIAVTVEKYKSNDSYSYGSEYSWRVCIEMTMDFNEIN